MIHQERKYRRWVGSEDLVNFQVVEAETDLLISAERDLKAEAMRSIKNYRAQVEEYIAEDPRFESSLEPIWVRSQTPAIIKDMTRAAEAAGVGPMAAVAGAIAEYVGNDLLRYSNEIIVENGGDIFIKSFRPRTVGVYAGGSPLTGKIALNILAEQTPLGVCTSSGAVGHSLSFGKADSVTVLSKSATLADAAATAVGNVVKGAGDIERGIELAKSIKGIEGIMIIVGDHFGTWGNFKIVNI